MRTPHPRGYRVIEGRWPIATRLQVAMTTLYVVMMTACSGQQALTQDELEAERRASAAVASLLFVRELDNVVSYNVRKDGSPVIAFADSVPASTYTEAVESLRVNMDIKGVRAEQAGREVCSLRGYR